MRRFTFHILALTLAGCSVQTYAEVESNTSWSGAFGDRTVDGSGNQRVNMPGLETSCAVVQKDTEQGYLRLRVRTSSSLLGLGPTTGSDWVETTAAYGVVSACD